MRSTLRMLGALVVVLSATVIDAEDAKTPKDKPSEGEVTAIQACEKICDEADAKCGSDVRRARMECSKNAANGGRDPFSQYRPLDYSYFCGYFNSPDRCGNPYYRTGCKARYQNHYHACLDAMRYNIASMRYDCFQSERDASNLCRDELRQCKAVCRR
jgi:hypothetical protein